MPGSRKKQSKKPLRTQIAAKARDPAELEKKQHEANMANAGLIMKHAMNNVMSTGAYRALIVLLETVRQWPLSIKEVGPHAFVPEFGASDIRAEEMTEDDETVINASFTYSGNEYDFACRLNDNPSNDHILGSMSLHENEDWVIRMDIAKNKSHEHFEFRELNAFRDGPWIANMVQIALEIEHHQESRTDKTG